MLEAATVVPVEPTYKVELKGDIMKIGFGKTADNDQIVRELDELLDKMIENKEIVGGPILKIDGPASLPVAFTLARKLMNLFDSIAIRDPKLAKKDELGNVIPLVPVYVVATTHGGPLKVGDKID